jgi:hypothetical protein
MGLQKYQYQDAIISAPVGSLTTNERNMAFVLSTHINKERGDGIVWPGDATIAREAGLKSRETVNRLIGRLAAKGWLTIWHHGEQRKLYLHLPVPDALRCDQTVTAPVTESSHPLCANGNTNKEENQEGTRKAAAPLIPSTNREPTANGRAFPERSGPYRI